MGRVNSNDEEEAQDAEADGDDALDEEDPAPALMRQGSEMYSLREAAGLDGTHCETGPALERREAVPDPRTPAVSSSRRRSIGEDQANARMAEKPEMMLACGTRWVSGDVEKEDRGD